MLLVANGPVIKRLRTKCGYSQQVASELAGIAPGTYRRAECGQTVTPATVSAVARLFDVTKEDLLFVDASVVDEFTSACTKTTKVDKRVEKLEQENALLKRLFVEERLRNLQEVIE